MSKESIQTYKSIAWGRALGGGGGGKEPNLEAREASLRMEHHQIDVRVNGKMKERGKHAQQRKWYVRSPLMGES